MEEQKDNKLDIEINPDVAEGVYSNLAVISHSSTEFVVDFLQMLPGLQKPMVRTRAILTPFHAKRLLNALADNVEKYESVFGRIPDNTNEQNEKYDTITPLAKA
ncbi:MAG: DUF3467 domain-containing protein [Bacteroidales bacterium]|nr:DUF3467 domain-containing protein [Bacteroidales bacterium]